MVSDSEINTGLAPFGFVADDRLCRRIRDYISLLLLWNQKISLTAVVEPQEIIQFHFGESLFAVNNVPIENGRLADVGSGAGFPGIPIAMAVSSLEVTLIEANHKKSAFLSEAVRRLDLGNAAVVRSRMSDVARGLEGFDFITARALGLHNELIEWSHRFLTPSGKLVLWLGEEDAILITNNDRWEWQSPIRIPVSRKRVLLIGSPKWTP